jgi:hypothetical protein
LVSAEYNTIQSPELLVRQGISWVIGLVLFMRVDFARMTESLKCATFNKGMAVCSTFMPVRLGWSMDQEPVENKSFLGRLWHRFWGRHSEKEKKRLKSFIPLILYAFAVMYGVIYLSILNTVNRYNTGATVKHWFGGDKKEVVEAKMKEKRDIEESFNNLRKRVSGGR